MPADYSSPIRTLGRPVLAGLRRIVTGDPQGQPGWVQGLASGDDLGYFVRGGAAWTVHADLTTLVGGVRALLLQTLHPAALAGVDDHSTYREDALGRLNGTARWLTVTTFGACAQADREAARVRAMHERVTGHYTGADGAVRPYRADEQRYLAWVHVAFTESFLAAHVAFSGQIPGGADAYVREWATAAELIGLANPPRSVAELRTQLDGFAPELARTPRTDATLDFLRRPPLPGFAALGYRVLFAAAVSTLRPEHRHLLGLDQTRLARNSARFAVRIVLLALRSFVGPTSPTMDAVMARHQRVQAAKPAPSAR